MPHAIAATGCVEDIGMESDYDKDVSELSIADGAFVDHYIRERRIKSCYPCDVMVGIHYSQDKVICARLNHGYRVGTVTSTAERRSRPIPACMAARRTTPSNPSALTTLRCVALEDAEGRPLRISDEYHDGRGPGNDGTQSDSEYGLNSPRMHVCRNGYAMRGTHEGQNDLYCGK